MTTSNTGHGDVLTEDQWLGLAERHANRDWNCRKPDGYLNTIKALCRDYAALSSASSGAGVLAAERDEARAACIELAHKVSALEASAILAATQRAEPAPAEQAHTDARIYWPERCPITGRRFFMPMEHPELGLVPTFGGPSDSFTIPTLDGEPSDPWHEREMRCERYDHDAGHWVEGGEPIPLRIVHEPFLDDVLSKLEEIAEPVEQSGVEGLTDGRCDLLAAQMQMKAETDASRGIQQPVSYYVRSALGYARAAINAAPPAAEPEASLTIRWEGEDGTQIDIKANGTTRDMRRLEALMKRLRALDEAARPAPAAEAPSWYLVQKTDSASIEKAEYLGAAQRAVLEALGHVITPFYTRPAAPLSERSNPLGELIGSFDAAICEGLFEALSETTDERLKDLVERRLLAGYRIAVGPSLSPQPTDEATDAEVTEAAVVMVYDRMDPFCAFGMGARWAEARLKAARLATPPDNAAGREGVK
jgi:hypothetical protein